MRFGKLPIVLASCVLMCITTFLFVYPRRKVYTNTSQFTQYVGLGPKLRDGQDRMVYVMPVSGSHGFFVEEWKKFLYVNGGYTITDVPAFDYLRYFVGVFDHWQSVPGSNDMYIYLSDMGNELRKFRINFSSNGVDGGMEDATMLAIEKIPFSVLGGHTVILNNSEPDLSKIKFSTLKRHIWKGDVIVIIPGFLPPSLQLTDSNGVVVAAWMIVRRSDILPKL